MSLSTCRTWKNPVDLCNLLNFSGWQKVNLDIKDTDSGTCTSKKWWDSHVFKELIRLKLWIASYKIVMICVYDLNEVGDVGDLSWAYEQTKITLPKSEFQVIILVLANAPVGTSVDCGTKIPILTQEMLHRNFSYRTSADWLLQYHCGFMIRNSMLLGKIWHYLGIYRKFSGSTATMRIVLGWVCACWVFWFVIFVKISKTSKAFPWFSPEFCFLSCFT